MLDGVELGEASEHDDWAWFAVVAGPAAEPCEDPNSPTGLASLGDIDLSPATAQDIMPESIGDELQGDAAGRFPRKPKSSAP